MTRQSKSSRRPILFVSSISVLGGAELNLIDMIVHLDRERFEPYLLTGGEGPLVDRLRQTGVFVEFGAFPFFSRRRPWIYAHAIWRIMSLIRRERIALLHVNCDQAVPHTVLAGKLTRIPIVCYIHDMTRAWFLPRYVKYLNHADCIVANSQATARYCVSAGMKADKVQVIYPCFDLQRFETMGEEPRQEELRTEWGIAPHEVAIGLVGHVLRYKGHEDFVRAAAMVAEAFTSVKFVIVGDDRLSSDPGFLPYLHELAEDLGITSHVIFAGYRKDIPAVMAALDIVAVPSWAEPFGRVVVEALAARRPVVATRAGGIPEIVEDGVTGLLVPPKDPEALARALLRLCENGALREQMGNLGPATARRFDVREHARQFERTYQAILAGRPEELPKVPFDAPLRSTQSDQG